MNITVNNYAAKHNSLSSSNRIVTQKNTGYLSFMGNAFLAKDTFQRNQVAFHGKFDFSEDELMCPNVSTLEACRLKHLHKLPPVLQDISKIKIVTGATMEAETDADEVKNAFPATYNNPVLTLKASNEKIEFKPIKVGVILSGGPAPGGHNVIAGLFDALKEAHPDSQLFGFKHGPSGLLSGECIELTKDIIDKYRNTGGFDLLGSGRTKLETPEQFQKVREVCRKMGITALTQGGGDDTNTTSALEAENFQNYPDENGKCIQVIGCPKTIDGDLKNEHIETSFGFETATRTYAADVSGIQRDAKSAGKYWHIVKVMGRSASNVALEVALLTHPNITLISEEIKEQGKTVDQIVTEMAQVIAKRAAEGKNYGVAVIPEGLIEHIPEMDNLLKAIGKMMGETDEYDESFKIGNSNDKINSTLNYLSDTIEKVRDIGDAKEIAIAERNRELFSKLPRTLQKQLVHMTTDEHGNIPVSEIKTEDFIISLLKSKLEQMKKDGDFVGKFDAKSHFLGYEGRSVFPTLFDCNYCYALGKTAAALITAGKTGYMAVVKNLIKEEKEWIPGGAPLAPMINMETRKGVKKPVIKKALVDINGPVFALFKKYRDSWAVADAYLNSGPIQLSGEASETRPKTLIIEQSKNFVNMVRKLIR